MGCQREIAQQIQVQGGDDILALKGNQGTLNEDVRLYLDTGTDKSVGGGITDRHTEVDCAHGRIETRRCLVTGQIDWLEQKSAWRGLGTLVMPEETCERNGKTRIERRFFISRLPANAKKIAHAIRAHRAIKNTLHWTLDVVFNGEHSRVHKENTPQNMTIVHHVVMNLLNYAKPYFKGVRLKARRKKAGWGRETLRTILNQQF